MAKVNVTVAGRSYLLTCKEGGEARLEALAADIAAKADHLLKQLGPMNESQLLLMSALLLADEMHELKTSGTTAAPLSPQLTETLITLAERAEALVRHLETSSPS